MTTITNDQHLNEQLIVAVDQPGLIVGVRKECPLVIG